MSVLLSQASREHLGELRHEPTAKWVRALVDGQVVADSTRPVLVWEPRRFVASYAVPAEDLKAELVPVAAEGSDGHVLLHPGIPFSRHSTPGEAFTIRTAGRDLESGGVPAGRSRPRRSRRPGLRRLRHLVRGGRGHPRAPSGPVPPGGRPAQHPAPADRARRAAARGDPPSDPGLRDAPRGRGTTSRARTSGSTSSPATPAPSAPTRARRATGRSRARRPGLGVRGPTAGRRRSRRSGRLLRREGPGHRGRRGRRFRARRVITRLTGRPPSPGLRWRGGGR